MDTLDFLHLQPGFSSPRVIVAYDELPLWSAIFGPLLLDEVPLTGGRVVSAARTYNDTIDLEMSNERAR